MEQNDLGVFKGQIRTTPDQALSEEQLKEVVEQKLGLQMGSINWVQILKRSIVARKKPVMMQLVVEAGNKGNFEHRSQLQIDEIDFPKLTAGAPVVLVDGCGPAGLYSALELIRNGIKPVIVERGKWLFWTFFI